MYWSLCQRHTLSALWDETKPCFIYIPCLYSIFSSHLSARCTGHYVKGTLCQLLGMKAMYLPFSIYPVYTVSSVLTYLPDVLITISKAHSSALGDESHVPSFLFIPCLYSIFSSHLPTRCTDHYIKGTLFSSWG